MSESPGACVNFSFMFFFTSWDGNGAQLSMCLHSTSWCLKVYTTEAPSMKTVQSVYGNFNSSDYHQSTFPCPPCKPLKTKLFLVGTYLLDPPHLPMPSSETHLQPSCKKVNLQRLLHLLQLSSLSSFSVAVSLTVKLQSIPLSYWKNIKWTNSTKALSKVPKHKVKR